MAVTGNMNKIKVKSTPAPPLPIIANYFHSLILHQPINSAPNIHSTQDRLAYPIFKFLKFPCLNIIRVIGLVISKNKHLNALFVHIPNHLHSFADVKRYINSS